MGWKAIGQPTVRKQRDQWVVRVDGIDTASGEHRPRQVGKTHRNAPHSPRRDRCGRTTARRRGHGELAGRPLRAAAQRDDLDSQEHTLRIDESLVATNEGAAWINATNHRSRRTIPVDDDTPRVCARRRAEQAAERLAAGTNREDNDLIVVTRSGRLVLPRSYDRALARIVDGSGLPRLTSHGLRHTAATHTVRSARDLGELRAIADLLSHSPEMLMNTYAHALPNGQAVVVDRLRRP